MSHLVHRVSRPWRAAAARDPRGARRPGARRRRRSGEGREATGSTTITPTARPSSSSPTTACPWPPRAGATLAGGAFSLPVVAGIGRTQDFTGVLVHAGGLRFTKGGKSVVVQKLVAVRTQRNAVVLAQVPGLRGGCGKVASALRRFAAHPSALRATHPGIARRVVRAARATCANGRVIVLARITGAAKQVSGASATLTADLRISAEFARGWSTAGSARRWRRARVWVGLLGRHHGLSHRAVPRTRGPGDAPPGPRRRVGRRGRRGRPGGDRAPGGRAQRLAHAGRAPGDPADAGRARDRRARRGRRRRPRPAPARLRRAGPRRSPPARARRRCARCARRARASRCR